MSVKALSRKDTTVIAQLLQLGIGIEEDTEGKGRTPKDKSWCTTRIYEWLFVTTCNIS